MWFGLGVLVTVDLFSLWSDFLICAAEARALTEQQSVSSSRARARAARGKIENGEPVQKAAMHNRQARLSAGT